jgi:poly [ADP-ribose] polymerase
MQTGLLIRPSGAVHTGSMFDVYFADKAQKSIGYSSLSGSHWTKGNENRAFLALFDVHVGNQKKSYIIRLVVIVYLIVSLKRWF